jgi:streptogramin lyase
MPVLRLVLLAVGLASLLAGSAQAAPVGALKQYKVPTANSQPRAITNGSDGNRWFTLGTEFTNAPPAIARITPAGAVTEFRPPCDGCIVSDIVQGPEGVLYYTSNHAELGRITTGGVFLPAIPMPETDALGGEIAVHGSQIWISDFNNDAIWRYDIPSGAFTRFDVSEPSDVAVDSAGFVWFAATLASAVGRLDPATGTVTLTPTDTLAPRAVTVAADGQIWFSARFTPQGVGRLNPATNEVTEFPLPANPGPQDIAGSPDGTVWFTQTTKGNIARIDNSGVITEGKVVKGSEPFGITVEPDGDPWYTMFEADKIGEFQLR